MKNAMVIRITMLRMRYENNTIKGYSWKNSSGNFVPEILVTGKTNQIITYYPNGKISAQIALKNGLYHGKLFTYYMTGSPLRESELMNDELVGVHKEYYQNGKLREVITFANYEKNGPYELHHQNGKIRLAGNFQNNAEHGEWHVYEESGKETELLYYHYGQLYDMVKK
jgi:antitoxin component YwqK of YwqJK toxin-antitoxin module